MIIQEYRRFLIDLNKNDVSDDAKRIGNIVFKHFNTLVPLGTPHSLRSKKIIEIAQNEFTFTEPEITTLSDYNNSNEFAFKRLKKIDIESFRGFTNKESFDLDASFVLVYGPNGSGKSSFCEALEYSLLGSVEEATVKRFFEINDYLENARTKKFKSPELQALNENEEIVLISPNDSLYRFCFVEKNRIDDFSRMAAKLPSQQNKLISTLFGLEPFSEFVIGFSSELDSRHIDLSGQKALLLNSKRQELNVFERTLLSCDKDLRKIEEDEMLIASKFDNGKMKYDELKIYLGTLKNPGRIQELENLTTSVPQNKIGLTIKSLTDIDALLKNNTQQIYDLENEYDEKRNRISFRNLYQSVKELNVINPDICPACSTPLEKVTQNPYLCAEKGLRDLEYLSSLEQHLKDQKEIQKKSLQELYKLVKLVIDFNKDHMESKLYIEDIPNSENDFTEEWWMTHKQEHTNGVSFWQQIELILKQIEIYDNNIDVLVSKRKNNIDELNRIKVYRDEIIKINAIKESKRQDKENASIQISQFDIENKDLIDEVESEKIKIDINKRIAKAYNEFVKKLNIYRNSLPSLLIADLAEKVKTLYNGFNRLDKNGDLLADVRLPLESGSKIEIAFNSNPSQMYDALHVLSEGHIRCLGLSILLAKNINQKCPLLVFDDPVNAIDDDHREGIRKTIFSEGLFIDTQIILTCHGEEFLKDISNILGVDKFCKTKTFTFIPHTGDNQLIIDYQTTPRNYIVAATEKFSRREIRESLTNCRRAMEFISNELWRLISRRMDGTIKLKFKDPKSKTELRNKIEQLKSKVTNNEFTHPKKDELLSAFTNILGIDGQSKEWRYLNDATHENEDCEEFDISTVKIIIDSLDVFDDLINHH